MPYKIKEVKPITATVYGYGDTFKVILSDNSVSYISGKHEVTLLSGIKKIVKDLKPEDELITL